MHQRDTTPPAANSSNCDTGHAEYKGGQGYRGSKVIEEKYRKWDYICRFCVESTQKTGEGDEGEIQEMGRHIF